MREALKRETKIELDKKRNGLVPSEDLIAPSKKLLALGTLYSSLVSVPSLLSPESLADFDHSIGLVHPARLVPQDCR